MNEERLVIGTNGLVTDRANCWFCLFTSFLIVLASVSNSRAQYGNSDSAFRETDRPRLRPGKYPAHVFRSPYRRPEIDHPRTAKDDTILGDWRGIRSSLAKQGIKTSAILISDPFWNVDGGLETGGGEYDLFIADAFIDTERFWGIEGGTFRIGFANNSGTNVSEEFIGNNFAVQTAASGTIDYRLTYLSWDQKFGDDKWDLSVGRLTINDLYGEEFLGSEYFKAFVSVGFTLVPEGPFFNAPGAFGYPTATWGARLKYEPTQSIYLQVGVYNGDPDVKRTNRHGVDFTMSGPAFVIGEIGFRRNYCAHACGLPGNLKFGAFYDGAKLPTFRSQIAGPVNRRSGIGGYYVLGDQALLRWGPKSEKRHLGVFASFVTSPDESISTLPYFFNAGILAQGILDSRPDDFTGLGFIYGSYSNDLADLQRFQALTDPTVRVQSEEMTIELTHLFKICPGLYLQPDIQYVVNPGGRTAIPNTTAVGFGVKAIF